MTLVLIRVVEQAQWQAGFLPESSEVAACWTRALLVVSGCKMPREAVLRLVPLVATPLYPCEPTQHNLSLCGDLALACNCLSCTHSENLSAVAFETVENEHSTGSFLIIRKVYMQKEQFVI